MFKFLDELSDTYTWPVQFNLPANGGKTTPIKFYAEFNRLKTEEADELKAEVNARLEAIFAAAKEKIAEGAGAVPASSDDDTDKVNRYILSRVLAGVGEADKSGNYTAADSEKETQLLSTMGALEAILAAYGKSKSGEKAKN